MFQQKGTRWRNLDNAGKLFSATSNLKDTRVFRFYCVLKEEVKEDILQTALEKTLKKYPLFLSIMRKGLFWHYLEMSELEPVVREEYKEPCSNLYIRDKKSLLFEVTYYKNRINFEVFHALTDGTGATEFLRELVKNYLFMVHQQEGLLDVSLTDDNLTIQDQEKDSFSKYYTPEKNQVKTHRKRAFQMRKTAKGLGDLKVTQGMASVSELLTAAREKKVSMTVLLTTAMICAIHEEMNRIQEKKPVVLMVPVNLRKFFSSQSMLNFFGWIEPGYEFCKGSDSFDDVLVKMREYFETHLNKEYIAQHMNGLVGLEKNRILKWAPLELKNRCIQIGTKLRERETTAVLSNMSVVTMPEAYIPYIEHFGVYTSTPKIELCICSFGDKLSFGFTSRYDSTNTQRNFFRILQDLGVDIQIEEPQYPMEAHLEKGRIKFFKSFSFGCIASAVISVMVNAMVVPDIRWSGFVCAGVLSMWIALFVGINKRHNLLKNAMWQLLIVSIGSLVWDLFTGWHRWSVDFVLPILSIVIQISMLVIARLQSHTEREYMIYYVMASVYGMLTASILLFTGVLNVVLPSILCLGSSFLFFLYLLFFKWHAFREEMDKKFHV